VHKFHRFHSVTNHFYISRPIFVHRPTFDAWPRELQEAMRRAAAAAVAMQRELSVEEDRAARAAILAEGCEIVELREGEHAAFVAAVAPLLAEARETYGLEMFDLLPAR
jgi:TRAP-type C4-dicarboxylate transport system substrate-binding protein